MGGLAIARMSREFEAQVVNVEPKGQWPLLLAIPEESLSTEEARRVLPAQYSRSGVTANIQNAMLLLAAFTQNRLDLLGAALDDRMHQPYRAHLCPLLPALQDAVGDYGILGVALSGAGPSVLLFLHPGSPIKKTRHAIRAHLERHNLTAELLATELTGEGACKREDWKRKHPS